MFIYSLFLAMTVFNTAQAANITWGKDKLLSVKVEYKGQIYRGELIGKMSDDVDRRGEKYTDIEKVGVLVYGLGMFGLDQVVPLESHVGSPICENFKYPYTALWSGHRPSTGSVIAKFTASQTVQLRESQGEWTSKSLSCVSHFVDTDGD